MLSNWRSHGQVQCSVSGPRGPWEEDIRLNSTIPELGVCLGMSMSKPEGTEADSSDVLRAWGVGQVRFERFLAFSLLRIASDAWRGAVHVLWL